VAPFFHELPFGVSVEDDLSKQRNWVEGELAPLNETERKDSGHNAVVENLVDVLAVHPPYSRVDLHAHHATAHMDMQA